jgi:hypothetical protein
MTANTTKKSESNSTKSSNPTAMKSNKPALVQESIKTPASLASIKEFFNNINMKNSDKGDQEKSAAQQEKDESDNNTMEIIFIRMTRIPIKMISMVLLSDSSFSC